MQTAPCLHYGFLYKYSNVDVMVFVIKVKNYKVSSKFVKSAGEKVYSIGFPSSEVLNGNLSFKSISEKIGAKSFEEWNAMQEFISGKPTWCYFDFDEKNGEKYGKLYKWFAVSDTRGLAPNGYHIPTEQEWYQLINFLGWENDSSYKLKNTSGWLFTCADCQGDNTIEFTAVPGGMLITHEDTFTLVAQDGFWWTKSRNYNPPLPVAFNLSFQRSPIKRHVSAFANYGLSVRCIKD